MYGLLDGDKETIKEYFQICISARNILFSFGAVQRCPVHQDIYFLGNGSFEEARDLASRKYKAGELQLPVNKTWTDFEKILEDVYYDHRQMPICYACELAQAAQPVPAVRARMEPPARRPPMLVLPPRRRPIPPRAMPGGGGWPNRSTAMPLYGP